MRFSGKVDYAVDLFRQFLDELVVAYVPVHEAVPRLAFELRQVGEISGVGELVQNRDLDLRPGGAQKAHKVGADEAGGPCNQEAPGRANAHLMAGPVVQS